jgi:hypothetical protein
MQGYEEKQHARSDCAHVFKAVLTNMKNWGKKTKVKAC